METGNLDVMYNKIRHPKQASKKVQADADPNAMQVEAESNGVHDDGMSVDTRNTFDD
jgi:hypothetical protein